MSVSRKISLNDVCKILHRYESGNIRICEFYRNGKLEGDRKVWYEDGQIMIQEFYKNGKKESENFGILMAGSGTWKIIQAEF